MTLTLTPGLKLWLCDPLPMPPGTERARAHEAHVITGSLRNQGLRQLPPTVL